MDKYILLAKDYCDLNGFKYLSVAYASDTVVKVFYIDTARNVFDSYLLDVKLYVEKSTKDLNEKLTKTFDLLSVDVSSEVKYAEKITNLVKAYCLLLGYQFDGIVDVNEIRVVFRAGVPGSHPSGIFTVGFLEIITRLDKYKKHIEEILNNAEVRTTL